MVIAGWQSKDKLKKVIETRLVMTIFKNCVCAQMLISLHDPFYKPNGYLNLCSPLSQNPIKKNLLG
jgi:hypothetical protein